MVLASWCWLLMHMFVPVPLIVRHYGYEADDGTWYAQSDRSDGQKIRH
ncbi:MAG TPA: hypothetical protein VKP04_01775 [Ktedonobacteraceae bacterium]|nr:hypothetical protein [Ktedonobacteraceae bacterium]